MILDAIKYHVLPNLRQRLRNSTDNKKISYSQCGEDLIMLHLCKTIGIHDILYLDVGAHHPTYLSNTYLFYESGGHGVCVEPDPSLIGEFQAKRPKDVNLNCGIGIETGVSDFFIMSTRTLNTFSELEAERYQSYGNQKIIQRIKVELKSINEIVGNNFERCPNLVSIDVEGLDYAIMNDFDFEVFRPEVFCLETLSYTENNTERKLTELIDLMHEKGYMTYADTYINTIFVDKNVWKNR